MFMTFLYIPVLSLFTSMIAECPSAATEHHSSAACWEGATAVRSVVVILVSFFYVTLSVTFALSVFQQDPTDRAEIMSRPHSRIEVYNLVVKTALSILFVAVESHPEPYGFSNSRLTFTDSIGCL
jgi:hypothetical protein